VGLTDLDSNRYGAVIRFKNSVSIGVENPDLLEIIPTLSRKVNEHGETVATKTKQLIATLSLPRQKHEKLQNDDKY